MVEKLKQHLLIVVVAIVALLGMGYWYMAHAADKGGPIYVDGPVVASPAHNFTGLYLSGGLARDTGGLDAAPIGLAGYGLDGRLGANIQVGPVVLGGFGDYSWDHFSSGGLTATSHEWAVGGLAGIAVAPSTMVYGVLTRPWITVSNTSISTVGGIGYGGGIETMLSRNFAIGLEYLHEDFSPIIGGLNAHEDKVSLRLKFNLPPPAGLWK